MIDKEELAICRRRGHVVNLRPSEGFEQCPKCGMWVRDVITREEREEEPPEAELSRGIVIDRRVAELKENVERHNARKPEEAK